MCVCIFYFPFFQHKNLFIMGGSQSHEISPEERRLRQDPEKILRIARFLNTQAEKRKDGTGELVEWSQHDQDKVGPQGHMLQEKCFI